ncbi:erythromycin esterase [Prauserella marina]|uniref:Erythromycin esterase n=1 Tax=Prauserella marina TaxID=530584 RepID=A0A1G6KQJ3_9PSEU|nr:erythromycin esterase [Prauserella marina]SDC33098.1 erythromycin esterase [Prauserella marina]
MKSTPVRDWIGEHAAPLSLDPAASPVALPSTLATADVAGLAASIRHARELVLATHVLLASLVDTAGFRAVNIEGTDSGYGTAGALDRYVRTGDGDPSALLAASQGFLRTREALEIVGWLRDWNIRNPADPVSVVHLDSPGGASSLDDVERDLALRNLTWLERTGQRIVHWGGTAHTLPADPRVIPPATAGRNAGGILRAELGAGYAAVALTVGSGNAPFPVPAPPGDFLESAFAGTGEPVLLELPDPGVADPRVAAWLRAPVRTRMIGPVYDPAEDRNFRIDGGPLTETAAAIVHVPRFGPVTPLG